LTCPLQCHIYRSHISSDLPVSLISPGDGTEQDDNTGFKDKIMSRVCELTGKTVMSGNNVSHALNRTRRKFRPNLVKATLLSDVLGQSISLKICTNALRTVEHTGGLDNFLVKAHDVSLSLKARRLKKLVKKKLADKAA